MTLFDTHFKCIKATAEALAVEAARSLGDLQLAEDFCQDLLLFLWDRVDRYDSRRGQATTFIAMCLRSGQKNIYRRMNRQKRRIVLMPSVPGYTVEPEAPDTAEDMFEFIALLPEPARTVCRRAYEGEPFRVLAAEMHCTVDVVRAMIADALAPYAGELGWLPGPGSRENGKVLPGEKGGFTPGEVVGSCQEVKK